MLMIVYIDVIDYYEFIKEEVDFAQYIIIGTLTYHTFINKDNEECHFATFNEFNPFHIPDIYIVYVPSPK